MVRKQAVEHHIIRRGESLSAIAARFGTTWQSLARANGLNNPDRLRVGQTLMIPGRSNSAKSPARVTAGRVRSVPAPVAAPRTPPSSAASAATPSGPGSGIAGGVTEAELRAIMPNAGTRVGRYLAPLNAAMQLHGINTTTRRAAFLAQVSVESGQLHNVVENLNYSASRLRVVWPKRFRSDETARNYAHNPEALANKVYADRLGNGDEASGDGYRYRGRGLMQTTGRSNYRSAGFENNPDALADPTTAADSAGRFWATNGLNARTSAVLSRQAFNGVSRTVNGGDHGSDERWAAYQRALRALQPASAQ
jgi:putative chitinase